MELLHVPFTMVADTQLAAFELSNVLHVDGSNFRLLFLGSELGVLGSGLRILSSAF